MTDNEELFFENLGDPPLVAPNGVRFAYVVSEVVRSDESIEYTVTLQDGPGATGGGDWHIVVWRAEVFFGHDDAHRAGGAAFVEASKRQDHVADILGQRIRKIPATVNN